MPGPDPRLMRWAGLTAGAAVLVLMSACMRPSPPIDPAEAPAYAAQAVLGLLERAPVASRPPASPPSAGTDTVRVWYPDHPLMRRLAGAEARAAFAEAHPGVTLEVQNIGEWMYAVQKLTVHLAGGGLPDIAIVRRDLLAQLAPSGRIVALDGLLSDDFLLDLEPPVRDACSVDGRLVALPADAYHSVLYAAPGATLDSLAQLRAHEGNGRAAIGHLPYLETLWALGGDVLDGRAPAIECGAGSEAFELMHALYANRNGRADAYALFDETHGLALFLAGRVPMTVASSRASRRVWEQAPETRVMAIPGASGGVSRWGEYAIVVFAEAEAGREALAAALDFLTGPVLQGEEALAMGSPPVRGSVREGLDPAHPLLSTFPDAVAAPLVPEWGEMEQALLGIVERVTRF